VYLGLANLWDLWFLPGCGINNSRVLNAVIGSTPAPGTSLRASFERVTCRALDWQNSDEIAAKPGDFLANFIKNLELICEFPGKS
jgi:hypothetical protein